MGDGSLDRRQPRSHDPLQRTKIFGSIQASDNLIRVDLPLANGDVTRKPANSWRLAFANSTRLERSRPRLGTDYVTRLTNKKAKEQPQARPANSPIDGLPVALTRVGKWPVPHSPARCPRPPTNSLDRGCIV